MPSCHHMPTRFCCMEWGRSKLETLQPMHAAADCQHMIRYMHYNTVLGIIDCDASGMTLKLHARI